MAESYVEIVQSGGKYYVFYRKDVFGRAKLIDEFGNKKQLCTSELNFIERRFTKKFNGSYYFKTKIGVFSAVTGNKVRHPKILKLFDCEV